LPETIWPTITSGSPEIATLIAVQS